MKNIKFRFKEDCKYSHDMCFEVIEGIVTI